MPHERGKFHRTALTALAGLALTACSQSASHDTYSFGKNLGCRSGYADAGWVREQHWPVQADASEDFRRGWQDGYAPCLQYGLNNPKPGDRP